MSTKTEQELTRKGAAREERTAAHRPVVLRDESDAIIDDLKHKLRALQGQIGGGAKTPPPEPERSPRRREAWNDVVVPALGERLQSPSQELTERLGRIITKVADPELRRELERCRETAFYLFDTFRRISDRHALLTETIAAEPAEVATDFMAGQVHCRVGGRHETVAVKAQASLPKRIRVAARPLQAVVEALAQIAADMSGAAPALGIVRAPGGKSRETPLLCLRVAGDAAWQGMGNEREVVALTMRPGLTAAAVVDLFYAARILEMQGGRLEFYRREGQVRGFAIWLPYEASGAPKAAGGAP